MLYYSLVNLPFTCLLRLSDTGNHSYTLSHLLDSRVVKEDSMPLTRYKKRGFNLIAARYLPSSFYTVLASRRTFISSRARSMFRPNSSVEVSSQDLKAERQKMM